MFSIHRKLFLALQKVQIFKITRPQVPFTRKKIPPSKFFDSPVTGVNPSTPYYYLENPDI